MLREDFHSATQSSMTRQVPEDHGLNVSPRPSHHLIYSHAKVERPMFDRSPSVCWGSEKEHCCVDSISSLHSNGTTESKSCAELMKEIALLEVEILNMESYLLSLYRTAYQQHLPTLSESCGVNSQWKTRSPLPGPAEIVYGKMDLNMHKGGIDLNHQDSDAHVLAGLNGKSETLSNSSSRREEMSGGSAHRSLADHLSASRMDDALKFPDKLSEEIIRCILSIYCRLANPSLAQKGSSTSSTSSTSSSSTFSPRNLSGSWSPCYNEEGARHCESEGQDDVNGPYDLGIEVLKLRLDDDSFKYAASTLQKFRTLVQSLEKVEPKKMKREEKLTFWINIHNALIMHAYLAYGTPNYMRNTSILKAAYNVGGYYLNANDIRYSILGIRSHYSAPWLPTFLSPGKKFLTGSSKHVYAMEYTEPLVHFALCSGAYSDPVLRIYTAKYIFQDLKLAKQEFIQANVYTLKKTRICLPKLLSYFAKDMSLDIARLLEVVVACLPKEQQKAITTDMKGRPEKHIYWVPSDSTFRYLIHRGVARGMYL